ncbi:AMIN domain-containing protein [Coleofasciculus sp. FACHB-SPT36]|uniref:AMIN domain-containing protein n=1 Tax=Cyanophyceae TaxID=3028117 RepID=UPI0018F0338A|nr:AMIN domain-containing protein [Coleofasciculus sp. FACHB-SPT36]
MSRLKTLSLVGAIAIMGSGMELKAIAARLTNWRFDPALNQLEITLDEGTTPRYFLLAQPSRIVLDLPNTQVGTVETQQSYSGPIRQIRVSQFEAGITRIVLDLAPEVVLSPQQVQLQVEPGNRWVLRPLIADVLAPEAVPPSRSGVSPSLPPPIFPEKPTPGVVSVPSLNNSSTLPNLATPTVPSGRIATNNPVLVSVPALSGAIATAPPLPVRQPQSSSATRVVEFGQPLPMAENPPQVPARRTRVAPVPSLEAGASVPMSIPATSTTAAPRTTASPMVVVPPLPKTATVVPDPSSSISAPIQAPTASLNPDVLLPSGTPLSLRYPGDKVLTLRDGVSRQEVLLLEEEIRDRTGKLIAPVGTQVIGRFEIDRRGSRFITQAISLGGRNFPLLAQSDSLDGNRQVSQNRVVRNSAIGALAVMLLGGFSGVGLLGGAAAGAATTYLTAPQTAIIQPNQILQVQLSEDWR